MNSSYKWIGVILSLHLSCQPDSIQLSNPGEVAVDAGLDAQADAAVDVSVVGEADIPVSMPTDMSEASVFDAFRNDSGLNHRFDIGVDSMPPDQTPRPSMLCPTSTPEQTRCCILEPGDDTHLSTDRVEVFGIAVTGDEGIVGALVTLTIRSEFGMLPREEYMVADGLGYFGKELRVGTGAILIEVDITAGLRNAHCEVQLTRD